MKESALMKDVAQTWTAIWAYNDLQDAILKSDSVRLAMHEAYEADRRGDKYVIPTFEGRPYRPNWFPLGHMSPACWTVEMREKYFRFIRLRHRRKWAIILYR